MPLQQCDSNARAGGLLTAMSDDGMIPSYLRAALAGAAATCSGNGFARFAYVPLFPAMVGAGWVNGGQAGLLGAAALGGYLVGTLGGPWIARRISVPGTLDLGMGVVVLSLAACAWNGGFAWLMTWRGMAGVGGGLLMALAGPASQAMAPVHRRGTAGGVVLAGVGIGIGGGALLIPALAPYGIAAAWLGLACSVALLWGGARWHWPDLELSRPAVSTVPKAWVLLITYGLHSAGMVPPMVYLADLAARGRGLGLTAGALTWLLFGIGGVAGGIASGRAADRLGGRLTLLLWVVVQTAALALCLPPQGWLVPIASVVAGFAAIGVTTVTLSVARELAPHQATVLWVRCTAVFGIVQTGVAFALAGLFAITAESHAAVFGTGLLFSVLALAAAGVLVRQRWP